MNAGLGPPSPCGKPLQRVAHGVYRLMDPAATSALAQSRATVARPSPRKRSVRDEEVARRVTGVIAEFEACLIAYDRDLPFLRAGQYEWHRRAIEHRRRYDDDVREALQDDRLLNSLHETLQKWGIGRRGSRLAPKPEFRERLRSRENEIAELAGLSLEDPALDVDAAARSAWSLIEGLQVVTNKSLIVAGTKTLHHLLPDLVPPMDRAWTGAFFRWSAAAPRTAQEVTFIQTFAGFAEIARAVQPGQYVGSGWRTSISKLVDNAIIGYCKTHAVAPTTGA